MSPKRIHIKNFKTPNPPNTVRVMRPGKWGNPFDWRKQDVDHALDKHAEWLIHGTKPITFGRTTHDPVKLRASLSELRGKHLACTCPDGFPCHGDLLLRLANGPMGEKK